MPLSPDQLRALVAKALASHPGEMGCGDCDARLDRFAELRLSGEDAAAALPLVEEHLAGCPGCREEFEALMAALRAEVRVRRPWWRRLFA